MDVIDLAVRFAVSLVPVVLFLLTLNYLDSYKLVHKRTLAVAIIVGCVAALVSLGINNAVTLAAGLKRATMLRYIAPPVEEALKALWVVWMITRRRVGFLVDAAIVGFAVGTGFAIIENTYYVHTLQTDKIIVWIVRGLGTAVMHGGMTAIFGIITKTLVDRAGWRWYMFLPGFLLVTFIHSVYNHFILPPVTATIVLHIVLPSIMLLVFWQSERVTRRWLGTQMDVDAELLEIIQAGEISTSRIGGYIEALSRQFSPEIVFDMICYLRLHVELAISAKGLMMMREAGFKVSPPEGTREKFTELRYLQKTIGPTGRLAMKPFLHRSTRDLWQIYMLDQ